MVVFYGKMKSTGALKGKIPQLSFFRIPAALFFNETKKRRKLIFYHTGSSPWDWYHRNVVSGGEGAEFLWDRSWAAYATLHVTRPLNWGVSVAILLSELFSEVLAWEATARSTLLASETRLAQRKRLDFILLPRFYFYFPRIVNGLCCWQLLGHNLRSFPGISRSPLRVHRGCVCMHVCAQSYPTIWQHHGLYNPPGSSIRGVFQARILK